MHTIVLLHSWRLGLCKVYTALQVLYLQRICHSICNNATVYQLVHYERLVAGGRCFYIFQLYRGGLRIKIRVTTVSHKTNSPLCPPLDLHCEK